MLADFPRFEGLRVKDQVSPFHEIIPGMRSTGESGIGLVPGLAKGSKEDRLAALERFEDR